MDSHIGLPRLEDPLDSQFRFENFFGEPSLVYVRVILLVEVEKMGEYLYPRTELETPRVYVCMYTVVMDISTRRWILIYQDLTSLSAHGSIFGKILGEPMLVDVRFILLVEDEKTGDYLHPYIESGTLRFYTMVMDTSTRR